MKYFNFNSIKEVCELPSENLNTHDVINNIIKDNPNISQDKLYLIDLISFRKRTLNLNVSKIDRHFIETSNIVCCVDYNNNEDNNDNDIHDYYFVVSNII